MHNSSRNRRVVVLAIAMIMMLANVGSGIREVGIGVILDMDSNVAKSTRVCLLMALEEVYGAHHNFTTIIRFHFRDSRHDNFQAASAAIDLVENAQVIALLGPQQSSQANFVLDIAHKYKVPIISQATSPDLSLKLNPHFIRISQTSSTQAKPLAALVKSFDWTEVVFVYENTDFGRGAIPYLFDAMVKIGIQVKYQAPLWPYSTDDSLHQQLHKLKTMQTRVFVVHMLPTLASRFFNKAKEVGMMAQGYAWIITDVLTGLLHHLNPQDLDSMQGVLGVKPYIPPSSWLTHFERKWRMRVLKEYPEIDIVELDMFGIYAYDFIFALAIALQKVESESSNIFKSPKKASTNLVAVESIDLRSKILPMIRNIRLKGLSGYFHVVNGQLHTFGYEIVNVFGKGQKHVGFWNSVNGLSNRINKNKSLGYITNQNDLGAIIWPGDALGIPLGWGNKKLRVGVPALTDFVEFFEAYRVPATNTVYTNGFCMDVFYAVMDAMPYTIDYEIIPYETPDGRRAGTVNDLIHEIVCGKFDMVAGDIAILWNRSIDVDFTLPYLDEGYAMLVPVKVDDRKSAWIFMKPLETKLWITIGLFFIYIGLVVWVLERQENTEFGGRPQQQVGTILWFSFSTLVFAHREKLINNLSRFVVIVWIFVVLVLTSSYTASLSSMLTVQKLEPTITNIYELIERGDYIGYHTSSFVEGLLVNMGFPNDKLKKYTSFQEYDKALSNGSRNNGVSAIVDGIPYLKMLQAKYCNKYLIVGPVYKTEGFGFAFPKGSPHVTAFSRAILKVVEGRMKNITDKWFGREDDCPNINVEVQAFDRLTLESFKGLFLIAGLSSIGALVAHVVIFLHKNKDN
ncbi:glutamate receptor 2.8-like [Bidens hawaiensis]|uniref:glutamate receptor 2.8-like n=1 Tax=Bidens hawaiensis TaxID=980011 RepID=UPI00404A57F2